MYYILIFEYDYVLYIKFMFDWKYTHFRCEEDFLLFSTHTCLCWC